MKIGIDAKWFFNGPPSGKVVIRQLLNEMLTNEKHKNNEFYVFLNSGDKVLEFPYQGDNIKLIYIYNFNNLVSNAFILPQYSKKYKIEVVLFQNFGTFSKLKKVVYIHDLLYLDYPEFYSFKERLYLSFIKTFAKKANTIVTISETEKKRIIKHKLGNNNVHFVHHGVDPKFKPLQKHDKLQIDNFKKKYDLPEMFILYLGRLNIRKNIANLINAMQYVDYKLVIVGEEDHKSENLSIDIDRLNLRDKIIFTGYINEEELPLVYAMATLFCFPSYAEGFGLPPLESMASGTPVIVSDRTSLPEVCSDAALYIDPDDPLDIAKKINILLASDKIIDSFANKGILQAKKFSWKKSVDNLMSIIKDTNDS